MAYSKLVSGYKPTLRLAHNKTLAAQLYSKFKEFFPENADSLDKITRDGRNNIKRILG